MRGAVRLAALMRLPVTYVWTHDSIGLGEDGPTHQPIEHLAALRAIPGLDIVRPMDGNETVACWRAVIANNDRPAGLALSRQDVPTVPRGVDGYADTSNVARGGYTLLDTDGTPDVILVGTGSEVQLAVAAREALAADGIAARVVSMPCREWFDAQDLDYRHSVLPPDVKARVSVEAGVAAGLARDRRRPRPHRRRSTTTAPRPTTRQLYDEFGITAEAVEAAATREHPGRHGLTSTNSACPSTITGGPHDRSTEGAR